MDCNQGYPGQLPSCWTRRWMGRPGKATAASKLPGGFGGRSLLQFHASSYWCGSRHLKRSRCHGSYPCRTFHFPSLLEVYLLTEVICCEAPLKTVAHWNSCFWIYYPSLFKIVTGRIQLDSMRPFPLVCQLGMFTFGFASSPCQCFSDTAGPLS